MTWADNIALFDKKVPFSWFFTQFSAKNEGNSPLLTKKSLRTVYLMR
jgi:hypothetical protein